MSSTTINVTISEESPLNFTISEETPINVSIQGYSIVEGAAILDDLNDVTITSPSTNDLLIYNGNKFVNDQVLKYIEGTDEIEVKLF